MTRYEWTQWRTLFQAAVFLTFGHPFSLPLPDRLEPDRQLRATRHRPASGR